MKRTIFVGIVGMALAALTGCSVFSNDENMPLPDYSNISVMVHEGGNLKNIIAAAAARRGWSVSDASENSLRLTIVQRSNLVEVNAIVVDDTHYSLHQVSSNIPKRKYIQWINNLKSTIANLAL